MGNNLKIIIKLKNDKIKKIIAVEFNSHFQIYLSQVILRCRKQNSQIMIR